MAHLVGLGARSIIIIIVMTVRPINSPTELQNLVQSSPLLLLDFWATWVCMFGVERED